MGRGQTDKVANRRTSRLLDQIGQVGRFDEKLVSTMELMQHIAQEHSINKETTELIKRKTKALSSASPCFLMNFYRGILIEIDKGLKFHPGDGYSY